MGFAKNRTRNEALTIGWLTVLMVQARVASGLAELRLQAEMAGAALGCRYSSSDEYEAALIIERRNAGAYRPPRHRLLAVWIFIVAAAALSIFLAL